MEGRTQIFGKRINPVWILYAALPSRLNNGPPDIANGGHVCKLFAEYIDGVIDVMIKRLTPLDRELQICTGGDGTHYLMVGNQMIISAKRLCRNSILVIPDKRSAISLPRT